MERKNRIRIGVAAAVGMAALCGAMAAVFGMPVGHGGPPRRDMRIDAATRIAVVAAVVDAVSRFYVYPDQAAKMSARLRDQLGHGDFDAITSANEFADALTESLRHDNHDRHLEVGYSPDVIPVPAAGHEDSPEDAAAFLAERKRFNFGFETVGRLPCDIGYTRALIIDLRRTHGGDPDSVMMVASYLYDKPTHLNDIWFRDENRLDERWTTDTVTGIRYGQSRLVYLPTSEDTFSAGEDFAYALKNNGRAVLVGETTGGGAHPGNLRRLSAHFEMNVPTGRAISPVTQTDWEGVGVMPDVKVPARKALDVAQVALLKKLLPAETDPEWQRKIRDRIGELD